LPIFASEMEDLDIDIFNLLDSQPEPSRGSLLVAKPTVEDLCFKRSVTILVDNDAEGSMGVIINKPTRYSLNDLMPELKCSEQLPLYLGGPVGTNMLFFLHTLGADAIPESVQLAQGVYFGGNFDVLKMFLESGEPIGSKVKFMVGYSGWAAGQLAGEVKRHDWAVLKDKAGELVFDTGGDDIWDKAVATFGDQYRMWAAWPDDVSMN